MPLLARMASPAGVVGALAPSTTILALIPGAVTAVIESASAAGIKTSTSKCNISSLVMDSVPGAPTTVPETLEYSKSSEIFLNPVTPPSTSLTATIFSPIPSSAIAVQ
ncbi:unannotated protein [freshwater metagenome]|uniref:Unannotated protein n=1 Tax=freshwater metagenome TaxID=449393 RepID=A0A6J7VH54_9ZZZZ